MQAPSVKTSAVPLLSVLICPPLPLSVNLCDPVGGRRGWFILVRPSSVHLDKGLHSHDLLEGPLEGIDSEPLSMSWDDEAVVHGKGGYPLLDEGEHGPDDR